MSKYTKLFLRILIKVYSKLDFICHRFWSRVRDTQQHYFCPKLWESLCKPKFDGCLKLTWKFLIEPSQFMV